MTEPQRRGIVDSLWARSKAFRITMIVAIFVFIMALAFLVWYPLREYPLASLLLLLVILVVAYINKKQSTSALKQSR